MIRQTENPACEIASKAQRKPIGRPRSFDRQEALLRAMHVFWRHGYERTSIEMLARTMGVKSPSIYAAFGDKRSLFAEALSLYAENEGAASKNAFVGRASARDAIHSMLHNSIELLMRFDPPRSCLVALGAFHSGDPVINAMLLERRMEIKIALRSLLESSEREGEILPGSPATLATIYSTFLHGLSIQIYDGETAEQLYAAANALLESWPVHQTI